jgi:hypothetical protein
MPTRANATFEVKSWDEKPFNEIEGAPKLAHVTVTHEYRGDIEGESTLVYLMAWPTETIASFVGLERVTGRIGDRSGTFVLQHTGTLKDGIADAKWSVVPGSGTGDLRGLRGEGGFVSGHVQPHPFSLDYEFE